MSNRRNWSGRKWFLTGIAIALFIGGPVTSGQSSSSQRREVNLRLAAGLRVRAIHYPAKPPLAAQAVPQVAGASAVQAIPIDGFIPYVAIALTNKAYSGELQYAHVLATSVIGTPLNEPMSQNYAIGILDTGGTINVIGQCDRTALGVTEAWLTGNTVPVGGAGGQTDADVTQPLGMFLAGLQAIDPDTLALDTTKLTGHWHVSAAIPQEEDCGDLVDIPSTMARRSSRFVTCGSAMIANIRSPATAAPTRALKWVYTSRATRGCPSIRMSSRSTLGRRV